MTDSEEVFTVERILSHKSTKKGRFFLVKWQNYHLEESTWEPEQNLFCKAIVEEYWRNPRPNMSLKKLLVEAAEKQPKNVHVGENSSSAEVDGQKGKRPKRQSVKREEPPKRFDCKAFTQLGLIASALVVLGFLIWRGEDTWYIQQYLARNYRPQHPQN